MDSSQNYQQMDVAEEFLEDDRQMGKSKRNSSGRRAGSWFESSPSSFKEDSYYLSDLKDSEKSALHEFKQRIEAAIKANEFLLPPPATAAENGSKTHNSQNLAMWGIPLLHSKGDERTAVLLIKFLRAREFRVTDAFTMLQNCMAWRQSFGADSIVDEEIKFEENLDVDLDSVAYMHGSDKDGHPVCYNAYGIFRDKVLYDKFFGDEEKLKKFLRWRVQLLEKGIRLLDFRPGGINAMIQITDLMDMPKRELRAASNHILALFQDNYPEMVARKVFINVPWYFSALYTMISPFLTQRTKSKFVIASEGKVAETLYKFIAPENIPYKYGGLSRPKDTEMRSCKPAADFNIRPGEKINLEIDGVEPGSQTLWEIIVGGWNVTYRAEFVPSAVGSYSILIDKSRKMSAGEQPVCNSYQASEAGKVVLIIDNTLSRRKKVASYRYMIKN